MPGYYSDKIIWITGASSGIGEAVAREANGVGGFVILSARNIEQLQRCQSQLKFSDKSMVFPMDMLDEDAVQEAVKTVLDKYGKVDIVVHSAGISQRSKIIETQIEVYYKLMDLNYFSVIKLTKYLLPSMIKRKAGQFVVISSIAGKVAAPFRSGYSASKHALHGFFDSLRIEHEMDGIKVNIICPGYTKTNIATNALNAQGNPFDSLDQDINNGMDPVWLAKQILKAVEQNKFETNFGGKEVLAIYIKRFFPKLLHRILLKRSSS